jgi:hypothetical protein
VTRLFFDTEFIDTGREVILLSIGVVRDDGATYYAEDEEADLMLASDWVRQNVLPHMTYMKTPPGGGPADAWALKPRARIAAELIDFAGNSPEWWAYMADYDWVVLSQLYGPLVNRPQGWPFWCHDVMQFFDAARMHGKPGDWVPEPETEHHALADAQWTKALWERVQAYCADDTALHALCAETADGQ